MATPRFRKWSDEWEAWQYSGEDTWQEDFRDWYNFANTGPPSGYMVCLDDRMFYSPRDFVAWLLRQAWSKLPFNK
jgi:hypothetical protein